MELELIKRSILEIRGKKVMLDMDLATIYEVETRVLKQAVRRNLDRFPEDFMFELNDEEFQNLTSQFVISSWGGQRHKPFAFTEQGDAMLSSVLKSKKAIQMNITIMRLRFDSTICTYLSRTFRTIKRPRKQTQSKI
jgi:hypothetical protein